MNWYKKFSNEIEGEVISDPYMSAISNNDYGLAQQLVIQKAQSSGYSINAYHSTDALNFTIFRTSGLSAHFGTEGAARAREGDLNDFSSQVVGRPVKPHRILNVFLSIRNPLRMLDLATVDDETGESIEGLERGEFSHVRSWEGDEDVQLTLLEMGVINIDEFEEVRDHTKVQLTILLKQLGYDGIVYANEVEGNGEDSFIIFDSWQVKLSDTITRDDSSEIIPLSERFQKSNIDMRW